MARSLNLSFPVSLEKYFALSRESLKSQSTFIAISTILGLNEDADTCDERTAEFILCLRDARERVREDAQKHADAAQSLSVKASKEGISEEQRTDLLQEFSEEEKAWQLLVASSKAGIDDINIMQKLGLISTQAHTYFRTLTDDPKYKLSEYTIEQLSSANWSKISSAVHAEIAEIYSALEIPNRSLLLSTELMMQKDKIDIALARAAALAIFQHSCKLSIEARIIINGEELTEPQRGTAANLLQKGGIAPEIARAIVAP